MIMDKLSNLKLYQNCRNLKEAAEYLQTHDLKDLPDGRTTISGEDLYVNVSSYTSKAPETVKAEAHNRYIDIQVMLSGKEIMGYAPRSTMDAPIEERPDSDLFFYAQKDMTPLLVREGMFTVFYPDDAHAPCMAAGEPEAVRKAVLKVRIR